ncbi:uncharacterized protein A1O9_00715 [Exophiala aquamarina CBS 119918]|uniref:C2 domain-containing protein n=1 Tax=Exophiala aquamarina CBS 119918 TaxID=1182545 RepID=A0A072PSL9_9EURO|nr:uncharacterized protein A1O9_00715 [Exophiala aquamarina CBS 119918]KEF62742.1 hypothetical protein A1O9_00715 [Exophiala aquamarina CBS 119918]
MATKARGAINAAHTAGIFADMSLDGPEIGTLVAVVDRAKNLPNRKTMGKQDPYCAMRLGKEAKKTDTDKRGGQTPKWDQELRFVVHDSLDYYKLKCSIFNDDKKTDLIGEAWIDLQEVIVPGGGQNDLWHQLNFKGKYAGDIRIELTFYDSRPKPEALFDKRKQRDKSHSTASDIAASAGAGSRQLGPREIKRRPLPPGPGGYSSPASAQNTPEQPPFSTIQPDFAPDAWINRQQNNTNPPPRPPKHPVMPETPDDIGYDLVSECPQDQYEPMPPAMKHSYDQRSTSFEGGHGQQRHHFDQRHSSQEYYDDDAIPDQYAMDVYGEIPPMQEQPLPMIHRASRSHDPYEPNTPPRHGQPASNTSPYYSSPPTQAIQSMPGVPGPQPLPWQSRGSPSPTKHAVYRDSPLRQSISRHDMASQPDHYVEQPYDDEPPPPPPAHGSQLVRMPVPPASNHTGYGSPIRTPANHDSIEERSPLQKLEYNPYQRPSPSAQEFDNQYSPVPSCEYDAGDDYGSYRDQSSKRRSSNNGAPDSFQPRPSSHVMTRNGQELPQNRSQQRYSASPQDEFRHSPSHGRPADNGHRNSYGPPRRAQTFDSFDAADDRQMKRSEPLVVRPRAISPAHTIPRKSITPTPTTPEARNSMGSTPFGPDSYDVLNPGTSPLADVGPFATPEHAKEASRQNELDKMRDPGPIIGNDGRIIDPSDHLPADTWAPEPERKSRKPEHVIKIRTREEARMHHRAGSSPASARPHSIATSPYQASPEYAQPPQSEVSPALPPKIPPSPQAESTPGRNRLKKAMPTRPLPNNPYPHAHTSPAVMTVSSPVERPSPTTQRYSIGSSPPSGHVQRPPLAEYQIPAGNTYHQRGGSARPDYSQSPSPTKASYPPPPSVADYGGYGADDSLALELSTIDIGPSRGLRTAVRSSRGYGGY